MYLFAGWAGLVLVGCVLAYAVHSLAAFPGDLAVAKEIQEPRAAGVVISPLLRAASVPGNVPWVFIPFVAAVGFLAARRLWSAAILMALTPTGDAMGGAVKQLVARARPPADVLAVVGNPPGFSFPSGHVVHYVVFFGALAVLSHHALRPSAVPDRRVRAGLLVVFGVSMVLIALVGPSRVFLGAHWPSDVVGGYVLGGAWLVALLAAHQRWVYPRWAPRDKPAVSKPA